MSIIRRGLEWEFGWAVDEDNVKDGYVGSSGGRQR